MFYCGIDIAKYKHEATVIDEAGTALPDSISFANSKEGCEKLLALFERLGVSNDGLLIGMEATGHYWLSVYGYLLEQGFEIKVINPIQSEAFRKMYTGRRRTTEKTASSSPKSCASGSSPPRACRKRRLWRCGS